MAQARKSAQFRSRRDDAFHGVPCPFLCSLRKSSRLASLPLTILVSIKTAACGPPIGANADNTTLSRNEPGRKVDSKSPASKADTQNLQAAGFPCAGFWLRNGRLLCCGLQLGTFIVPCNLHRPIRAPCCRARHAGHTHSRGPVHEKVSPVPS